MAAAPGDVVRVSGGDRRPLGYALYSSRSVIALRMLTRRDVRPGAAFWRARLEAAIRYRESLDIDSTAYRLVHGEGDRLPGLVVDRYGEALVVQALAQATDRLLPLIGELLVELLQPAGILARNDPQVRALEGLDRGVELRHGSVPQEIEVREGAVRYVVDPWQGQKTGLFLDQRENRLAAARYARGRAFDGFSYTGGFALQMAPACDEVETVDVSESAAASVERNAEINGVANVRARAGNVFDVLRDHDRAGERFDTIVLDPPAFAKKPRGHDAGAGRLQGDQPARAPDPVAGRGAHHVELLLSRRRAGFHTHDRGGRGRRSGGCPRRGEAAAEPRPSGAGDRARNLVSEVRRAAQDVAA